MAIKRNSGRSAAASLIEALGVRFPVVKRLVGDKLFHAMGHALAPPCASVAPTLLAPLDGAHDLPVDSLSLEWTESAGAIAYEIRVWPQGAPVPSPPIATTSAVTSTRSRCRSMSARRRVAGRGGLLRVLRRLQRALELPHRDTVPARRHQRPHYAHGKSFRV